MVDGAGETVQANYEENFQLPKIPNFGIIPPVSRPIDVCGFVRFLGPTLQKRFT